MSWVVHQNLPFFSTECIKLNINVTLSIILNSKKIPTFIHFISCMNLEKNLVKYNLNETLNKTHIIYHLCDNFTHNIYMPLNAFLMIPCIDPHNEPKYVFIKLHKPSQCHNQNNGKSHYMQRFWIIANLDWRIPKHLFTSFIVDSYIIARWDLLSSWGSQIVWTKKTLVKVDVINK